MFPENILYLQRNAPPAFRLKTVSALKIRFFRETQPCGEQKTQDAGLCFTDFATTLSI